MKIFKLISIILLPALLFCQCTDAYDGYNKTGIDDEEGERDAYFLRQHIVNMQNWIIPSNAHAHQFTEQLLGGPYGGYFTDVNPGFNNKNFATYTPEDAWSSTTFNNVMSNAVTSYTTILRMTTDPVLLSVAKVLRVMTLARVTDIYGPIPYSELTGEGNLNAAYDSQKDVYEAMVGDLNEAIEVLTENQTNAFSSLSDRFYGGNTLQWVKMANSMKLRLAIRMADVNNTFAKKAAEEVIAHEVGPIVSNTDNVNLALISGQSNPYQVGLSDWNGGDTRISADITSYMNGYNDPRRSAYFDVSGFGGYIGFRNGVTIPSPQSTNQKYSNMSTSLRSASNMRIMCAAEIAFLKAEGALRGWNMGGTAKAFYEEGITLSFQQNGVTGASAYIADNTSIPGQYVDPEGLFSYTGITSTVKIAWDDTATSTDVAANPNFERIITQKWIAIFPDGIEAWTEYRRTGYPALMPVITNNSSVVSSARKARRLAYPNDEYTGNLTNVQHAVSNLLGGADNMATDLWWAKKN